MSQQASDRRSAKRKPASLPATLRSKGLLLDARVVDMSATGAKVKVADWVDTRTLPARLNLVLLSDRTEVAVDIVWRRAQMIGLRFASAFRISMDLKDEVVVGRRWMGSTGLRRRQSG
ncbi:MAG: PilZ domain-containing protein [Proteobacteria bacterium]|nr:PilZ domain-containing protein [Pseudomonadota bacterium]